MQLLSFSQNLLTDDQFFGIDHGATIQNLTLSQKFWPVSTHFTFIVHYTKQSSTTPELPRYRTAITNCIHPLLHNTLCEPLALICFHFLWALFIRYSISGLLMLLVNEWHARDHVPCLVAHSFRDLFARARKVSCLRARARFFFLCEIWWIFLYGASVKQVWFLSAHVVCRFAEDEAQLAKVMHKSLKLICVSELIVWGLLWYIHNCSRACRADARQ